MTKLLTAFRRQEIQVLIGTQMVAKGHDFPGVTLVGVLAADHGLKFPDFRASERTFQLVTQVAGRAGRADKPGRVLIQTFDPGHHSLQAAQAHSFQQFLEAELPHRRLRDYPPFSHLALVLVTHLDAKKAEAIALDLAMALRRAAIDPNETVPSAWVLGPVFAPIQRIKGKTRIQILVKARDRKVLHRILHQLDQRVDQDNLAGTVALDVDPIHLL
jgi:primosomal protein N' (replication factor Y)